MHPKSTTRHFAGTLTPYPPRHATADTPRVCVPSAGPASHHNDPAPEPPDTRPGHHSSRSPEKSSNDADPTFGRHHAPNTPGQYCGKPAPAPQHSNAGNLLITPLAIARRTPRILAGCRYDGLNPSMLQPHFHRLQTYKSVKRTAPQERFCSSPTAPPDVVQGDRLSAAPPREHPTMGRIEHASG